MLYAKKMFLYDLFITYGSVFNGTIHGHVLLLSVIFESVFDFRSVILFPPVLILSVMTFFYSHSLFSAKSLLFLTEHVLLRFINKIIIIIKCR